MRQHAHNPVFWYPWGAEAIELARSQNKPIFLSIGYSTCYWCHVMEREVFENVSIAAQMNEHFINIKIDREEHPELDEIYMVARQMMTQEGGWPNNLFLTPDLKPFLAGGTYSAQELYGKPAFPRLLEWVLYIWTMQEQEVRETADKATEGILDYLTFKPQQETAVNISAIAQTLFKSLSQTHDERSGGFYQAPKFPNEPYLAFLLEYYAATRDEAALNIVVTSLRHMAAGGVYDHVGCGFHRYAVDKEWYVPHFEKMLYNQAQLARIYTDAAAYGNNAYFADIAKSILDVSMGPFSDANGGFYAAFDAETDGVEGAYYAWTPEELEAILSEGALQFFTEFYALADIPKFKGHKHVEGKVIIARKPLDVAAYERHMPYVEVSALSAELMNSLLANRNLRQSPNLDDKIIVAWNGLMIDAYAHAGRVFKRQDYIERARKAADFILEKAIDNNGALHRIYAGGKAQLAATLEDYAYLIKGLISLWRAKADAPLLESIVSLAAQADELFSDEDGGYFFAAQNDYLLARIKHGDDSAVPSANGVMLHNLVDLYDITKEPRLLERAEKMAALFLQKKSNVIAEASTMVAAALRLERFTKDKTISAPQLFDDKNYQVAAQSLPETAVAVGARLSLGNEDEGIYEVLVSLAIKQGWHINTNITNAPYLIPTQIDIQGSHSEIVNLQYPEAKWMMEGEGIEATPVYTGSQSIIALVRVPKEHCPPQLKIMLRYQPCYQSSCYEIRDVVFELGADKNPG